MVYRNADVTAITRVVIDRVKAGNREPTVKILDEQYTSVRIIKYRYLSKTDDMKNTTIYKLENTNFCV